MLLPLLAPAAAAAAGAAAVKYASVVKSAINTTATAVSCT